MRKIKVSPIARGLPGGRAANENTILGHLPGEKWDRTHGEWIIEPNMESGRRDWLALGADLYFVDASTPIKVKLDSFTADDVLYAETNLWTFGNQNNFEKLSDEILNLKFPLRVKALARLASIKELNNG